MAMPDQLFCRPKFKAPLPRASAPGEQVWSMGVDHVTWSCELRYRGEWGIEAEILREGELALAGRFETRALALQWAQLEYEHLEQRSQAANGQGVKCPSGS
jgi:hypothetical protein